MRTMTKLTHYTSFEDMKSSKNLYSSDKSVSQKESDLKNFITLLKTNSSLVHPSKTKTSNKSKGGK
jgi:hypothetical protein